MTDTLDVVLLDAEQTDEIHLVTELIVAASESDAQLSQSAIDAILRRTPEPPQEPTWSQPRRGRWLPSDLSSRDR